VRSVARKIRKLRRRLKQELQEAPE